MYKVSNHNHYTSTRGQAVSLKTVSAVAVGNEWLIIEQYLQQVTSIGLQSSAIGRRVQ